jgi:hypothetical protein
MNRYAGWLILSLLLAAPYARAQVINFDDVPDATDISTHYSGLTFSCAGTHCASPSIFARQTLNPVSAPNTVSATQTGMAGVHNPTTGTIRVGIACLATKVSIQARSIQVPEPLNQVQHAILVAQNGSGTSVGQATGTKFDQFEPLTVSSPTNLIATILLGVEGTGVAGVAQFDDLTIECAPRAFPWHWWLIGIVVFVGIVIYFWRRPRP